MEIIEMHTTISYAQHLAEMEALRNSFQEQINSLQEQIKWLQKQLFGPKTEKSKPSKEAPDKTVLVQEHTRKARTPNGKDAIILPEDLPVVTEVIDIPEQEKTCAETGLLLVKIREAITTKLAYKPASYYLKRIVRPIYALPKNSEGGIRVANLPESLLERCEVDDSFLADLVVKKYADHLPLYRQSEILKREDIQISRQILSRWVVRVGQALKPLWEEMKKQILQSNNVFLDETPVKMLDTGAGEDGTGYVWTLAGGQSSNPPYRIYQFAPNRRHHHAKDIIGNYNGRLHSDKYGAYENLATQMTWCPCWAHIRRKFLEAESGDLPLRSWILRQIKYLFMLERVAWARSEEKRLRIRQEKEVPIIDKLIAAIKEKIKDKRLLPKSKFRQALGYFIGLIPYLKNYTNHAWARIDNNIAERAVRPLALGRKNWLFVGNEDSGEAAGVLLSLIQTCIAAQVNPREYLEDIMRRLMSHNAARLFELLPDQWAAANKKQHA